MAGHNDLGVLFSPVQIGPLTLRNRIGMSPMCQYSAVDGMAQAWHMAHLGGRATGGLGLMMVEATGVLPEGRITPGCTGLWNDAQRDAFKPIVGFVREQGTAIGIQLAHAGRKASCALPWQGGAQLAPAHGGWQTVAPSPVAFRDGDALPKEMTADDIAHVVAAFAAAARRAAEAAFDFVEIHAAHGYLLHAFLSPLTNLRTDGYGGALHDRARALYEVTMAVRAALPARMALLVRLSCSDWVAGGLTPQDCVEVARRLKALGVDLVDCSSGGAVQDAKIPAVALYQVPFARLLRAESGIPTAAVGMITTPAQAAGIVGDGAADVVLLGRALLRDPYWALKAAAVAGVDLPVARQYLRGIDAASLRALAATTASEPA